jgi:predicted helicase
MALGRKMPAKRLAAVERAREGLRARVEAAAGSRVFAGLGGRLRAVSSRPLSDGEIVDHLVNLAFMGPMLEALFRHYPYYRNNPYTDWSCALPAETPPEVADAFGDELAEVEGRLAAGPTRAERQNLICEAVASVYGPLQTNEAEWRGVVFTPVDVVDFMIRSVAEVVEREFGAGLSGVPVLDPFGGLGIFTVRTIELDVIGDDEILDAYDRRLAFQELNPTFWSVAKLNVEEAFWTRTGGVHGGRPFLGGTIADTFGGSEGTGAESLLTAG